MKQRIFYAAGPGNIIQAHKYWAKGQHYPNEVSITFSSQFEQFCKDIGAEAYLVSYHNQVEVYQDGPFTLEHRPKPMRGASGPGYHLAEIFYGLGLLKTAVQFKATVAVLLRFEPLFHSRTFPASRYQNCYCPSQHALAFRLSSHGFDTSHDCTT